MQRKIIPTEDGSHTLRDDELNEYYHSTHGAIQESEHVFIQNGFHKAGKWLNPLNILEVGFGSGLNALLTYRTNQDEKRKINYIAIEPYPLTKDEVDSLNYPENIPVENARNVYSSLHKDSDTPFFIGEQFIILPLHQKIQDVTLKDESINVIYFDAFSPSVQPEIWEKEIFRKLYDALEWQGILVTYSVSGNVKRALTEAGFTLEHPEGPAGKRAITVAKKEKSWSEILS